MELEGKKSSVELKFLIMFETTDREQKLKSPLERNTWLLFYSELEKGRK